MFNLPFLHMVLNILIYLLIIKQINKKSFMNLINQYMQFLLFLFF